MKRTPELLDKAPPQSMEAELAVIGCVLLKPDLFAGMNLDAVDFHAEEHQKIWRVFEGLARGGVGIDIITTRDCLMAGDSTKENRRELSDNHAAALAEAAQSVAVCSHWPHYRDIVVRTCAKRTAIRFLIELLHGAYDDDIEPDQWVSTLLTRGKRMQEWLQRKRRNKPNGL